MISLVVLAAAHPYQMDIGPSGRLNLELGYTRTATGKKATPEDIAASADGHRFVLVGETHDNGAHHKMQADVIKALVARGRDVSVGLEMFTRDNQASMAPWTLGRWTEEAFQERANWKTQWGFPYSLYKPIFDVVKENRLPMAALNFPRDWVRKVGREGPAALSEEQKKWAPNIDVSNQQHRAVFKALIGGHPLEGQRGENMYAAQVSWDEGMAQSAVDFMARRTHSRAVMVIIAGSGHTLYDLGINLRLKMKGYDSLNVTGIELPLPEGGISRGLADYVYVSEPVQRPTPSGRSGS
jgi:uncharacterized iron-regulated protein